MTSLSPCATGGCTCPELNQTMSANLTSLTPSAIPSAVRHPQPFSSPLSSIPPRVLTPTAVPDRYLLRPRLKWFCVRLHLPPPYPYPYPSPYGRSTNQSRFPQLRSLPTQRLLNSPILPFHNLPLPHFMPFLRRRRCRPTLPLPPPINNGHSQRSPPFRRLLHCTLFSLICRMKAILPILSTSFLTCSDNRPVAPADQQTPGSFIVLTR